MTEERVVALLGPSMIFFNEGDESVAMKGLQETSLRRAGPGVRWRCESHLVFAGPSMAGRAEALVATRRPDAAVLVLSAFQFTHESVVLRVKARWPRLYPAANFIMQKLRALGGAGLEGAPSPRSRLFTLPRRLGFLLIGGVPDTPADEFITYCKETLAALSRHEDLVMLCRLPVFYWRLSPRRERRARQKVARVNAALSEFCRAHHIAAYDLEQEAGGIIELSPAADGVHFTEATRRFEAEVISRYLLADGLAAR